MARYKLWLHLEIDEQDTNEPEEVGTFATEGEAMKAFQTLVDVAAAGYRCLACAYPVDRSLD